jgi:PPOX class probable F420-dependent enzyme
LKLEELPQWGLELLASARVGHLGLLDEGDEPRVLVVTFALWEGAIWSAIDAKPKRAAEPARVRRLRRRPSASFLVDAYAEDWSALAWIELRGPVTVEPLGPALDALASKYPQYAADPPPGPLLRLAPERCGCWRAADF